MKGNLALTFLFKDQDLHEIIKFKARESTAGGAPERGSEYERRKTVEMQKSDKLQVHAPLSSSPKDKQGRSLYTDEEYQATKAMYLKESGEEMAPREIRGYYTRKVRYNVKTVNDFITKLRKTAVCDKFFQQNDLEYSGLQELFKTLFAVTRQEIERDELLNGDEEVDDNMIEISNFVMYNLCSEFFYNRAQSKEEVEL